MFRAACELKRKLRTALFAAVLLSYAGIPASVFASASGQEHPPTTTAAGEHADQESHAEGDAHDVSIVGMLKGMAWPVANFIIFIGVLYYFFNKPFTEYLSRPRRDDQKRSRRSR